MARRISLEPHLTNEELEMSYRLMNQLDNPE